MHVPQIAPETLKPQIPKFSWGSMPPDPPRRFNSLSTLIVKAVPYNLIT